jgi:hypothetical protein
VTEKITTDELYQLRGLLSKLAATEPLNVGQRADITSVYACTSVLLDERRAVSDVG